MIQIEFRGMDSSGKWNYGFFCKDFEGNSYITSLDGIDTVMVKGETVGQYLNLTDKENKKIYHGDLVDFEEKEWGNKFEPEVFLMEHIIGDWELCGSKSDLKTYRKVVGNIHEKKIT